MEEPNFVAGKEVLNFNSAVEAIIGRSCIIDYGIIQKVVAGGIVNVSLAVAKTKQDIVCMTCVLANIASNSLTLDIVPKEGDRVVVVYPRLYDSQMFTIPEEEEKIKEIIVNPDARGYSVVSGIAFLANQYKKAAHKNLIQFDSGKLTLKLAYNKNNDKNLVELTADDKGDIVLKNAVTTITMDKDGDYEIDNGKAKVSIDKDGNVVIDAMNGKLTLKNNKASLFDIMDSTLNTLNTTYKTQGSPYTHTTIPNQLSTEKTQLGQLMQ